MMDTKKIQDIIDGAKKRAEEINKDAESGEIEIYVSETTGFEIHNANKLLPEEFFKAYDKNLKTLYNGKLLSVDISKTLFTITALKDNTAFDNYMVRLPFGSIDGTDLSIGIKGMSEYQGLLNTIESLDAKTLYTIKDNITRVMGDEDARRKFGCEYATFFRTNANIVVDVMAVNLIKLIKKGTDTEQYNYIGDCRDIAIEIIGSTNLPKDILGINDELKDEHYVINTSYVDSTCISIDHIKHYNGNMLKAVVKCSVHVVAEENGRGGFSYGNPYMINTGNYLPGRDITLYVPYGYDLSQSFKAKYI